MSRYDVAIVGLGPTGATLANLCGMHGLRTVVYERSTSPYSQPRACHLDAEIARVFQHCGYEQELHHLLTVSGGMHYVDRAGRELFSFEGFQREPLLGWLEDYVFVQPQLEMTLRRGLAQYRNVDVHLAWEAGRHEQLLEDATYLVACDGGSSRLRDELGIGHDPSQHVAYVASWVKALEEDPLEIFRAASDAEKIQDYVLSLEQKQVQEQSTEQSQAEQEGQILAELQELHQAAYEGYSPLESWDNLKATAQASGLTASISRGGAGEYDPPYVVAYADQAGQKTPITTELFNDGKAVTSVSGQRVPGTGLTSDHEWQSAALNNAVAQVRSQALTQGADMKQPSIEAVSYTHLTLPTSDLV